MVVLVFPAGTICVSAMGSRRTSTSSSNGANPSVNNPCVDEIPKIVLDPVLSYVHAGLNSGSVDATAKAALAYFPRTAIDNAKDILYKECQPGVTKPKRATSELRSASEADLMDIISTLRKLDTQDRPPVFAVQSTQLGSLPKARPEELMSISMAERLCNLEEQLSHMKEISDGLILSKLDHSFRLTRLENREAPVPAHIPSEFSIMSGPVQGSSEDPAPCNKQLPVSVMGSVSIDRPSAPRDAGHAKDSSSQPKTFAKIAAGLQGSNLSKSDSSGRSGRATETRPKRRIVGKSAAPADSGLKGAREPNRFLFISRVEKECTANQIAKHLHSKKFTVCDLECVSVDEAKFKSYKLTVPKSQFNELFNEALWPEGVCVQTWRERRKKKEIDSSNDLEDDTELTEQDPPKDS